MVAGLSAGPITAHPVDTLVQQVGPGQFGSRRVIGVDGGEDIGTLASSADFPAADRDRLLDAGSPTTARGEVLLTKPPLAAWAVDRVLSCLPTGVREQRLRQWFPVVLAAQDWWFTGSDSDHDGVPEYLHPYSSGLDDSPVFDHRLPVTSPDLLGYLVVQNETLARWCRELPDLAGGDPQVARRLTSRSARMRAVLAQSWSSEHRMFLTRAGGEALADRTVVALLGCFAGDLHPDLLVGSSLRRPGRAGEPGGGTCERELGLVT